MYKRVSNKTITGILLAIAIIGIFVIQSSRQKKLLTAFEKADQMLQYSDSVVKKETPAVTVEVIDNGGMDLFIYSNKLSLLIDTLIMEIRHLKGREQNPFSYKNVTLINELKEELQNFNHFISTTFPNKIKPTMLFDLADVDEGNNTKTWEVEHFYNTTAVQVIKFLKQLQNRIFELEEIIINQ